MLRNNFSEITQLIIDINVVNMGMSWDQQTNSMCILFWWSWFLVITKQFSEKTRNLWPEYKCIWQKNISSDTWEIVFGYYETIIRKNTQPIIKYKCIWHRIISSNRDKTRNTIYTWRYNPLSCAFIFRLEVACFFRIIVS